MGLRIYTQSTPSLVVARSIETRELSEILGYRSSLTGIEHINSNLTMRNNLTMKEYDLTFKLRYVHRLPHRMPIVLDEA